MYSSNDIVDGITIKDCFKNLVDLAWETRSLDEDLANKFFDILVECLGVDFRIDFDIDKNLVPNGNTTNLILNNFKNAKSCINMIDGLFNSFPYMVHEGVFSNEYYGYLMNRRGILEELIGYQSLKANQDSLDKEAETKKYMILSNDLNLLDKRIALVEANTEARGR